MENLKLCPFCGHKAKLIGHDVGTKHHSFEVYCGNNKCQLLLCSEGFDKEEVIKMWNKRAK